MHCRFCKTYLGFNDNVICEDADCVFLKTMMVQFGVTNIANLLRDVLKL